MAGYNKRNAKEMEKELKSDFKSWYVENMDKIVEDLNNAARQNTSTIVCNP